MWCDNCLLVLPLRAGAIAWNVIIAAYSIAGSIILFLYGSYWFFFYPEWFIYGGIGMAVAAVALVNCLALSNKSYIWTRVCKFLWPILIVVSAVRCIIMIVELDRDETGIEWECNNGGVQYNSTTSDFTTSTSTSTLPSAFCTSGFSTLRALFIISLLIDLVFQLYSAFLNWRFSKRLEHYSSMKGPFYGGYYNA
ncbi:unnamed protein product [Peniophora sp. CBMAI 1063]|nr:unnamed protein product [Peniophora sp. CBMAI 1063]